jgi:hypothetical protein
MWINFLLQKIQEESNIFKKNENLNIDLITNDVDITLDLRDKSNESNHNLCVTDCAKKNALNILEKNKQAIETFKKSEKDQNYLVAIKIKNPSFKRSDSKKLSKIENMNKGFENYQKIEVYNKSINRNLIFKRKQDDEENKKKANEYYNKALNEKDMKKKLDFFDKSISLSSSIVIPAQAFPLSVINNFRIGIALMVLPSPSPNAAIFTSVPDMNSCTMIGRPHFAFNL